MDGERFDTIAKGLATGSSRRRVIGGVLGSTVALLAGRTTLAAKGKKGKKAKSRKAKVRAQSENQGKGQEKVTLCHWDEDTQRYEVKTVGAPGADAHFRKHKKDREYIDCCTDFGGSGDAACPEDRPICNGDGKCVECLEDEDCTETDECNSVGTCNDQAACEYRPAVSTDDAFGDVGSPCDGGAGLCLVKPNSDGRAVCVTSNTGITCVGTDPCGDVGGAPACDADDLCGCYSTIEGAGLCLLRDDFKAPGIGCASVEERAACNTSDQCAAGEVCAPLDRIGTRPGTNCCVEPGLREATPGFRGFCVDVLEEGALCPAVPR
jgi:hypothetical protein